jgi:pantoate--beta-alanine ligase
MIIFKKASQLSQYLQQQRNSGKKTGFVPTMGALHDGHLSLVGVCREQNELTICSIFINPTQFNNPEDFKHYPVTLEKDLEKLIKAGCDVLFLPSVEEIYQPDHIKKHYDLGELEQILEGHYRPGHFQGVCEVVDRLLNIILPHQVYLGQKDYQQCMVIKKLIGILGMQDKVQVHIQPTKREPDGLAMSSRNLRLNPVQRSQAPAIFRALDGIRQNLESKPFEKLESEARHFLSQKGFEVDYVTIARAEDLGHPNQHKEPLVALVAASLGKVRLIDNLLLN